MASIDLESINFSEYRFVNVRILSSATSAWCGLASMVIQLFLNEEASGLLRIVIFIVSFATFHQLCTLIVMRSMPRVQYSEKEVGISISNALDSQLLHVLCDWYGYGTDTVVNVVGNPMQFSVKTNDIRAGKIIKRSGRLVLQIFTKDGKSYVVCERSNSKKYPKQLLDICKVSKG